jgi:hypothetical protein
MNENESTVLQTLVVCVYRRFDVKGSRVIVMILEGLATATLMRWRRRTRGCNPFQFSGIRGPTRGIVLLVPCGTALSTT